VISYRILLINFSHAFCCDVRITFSFYLCSDFISNLLYYQLFVLVCLNLITYAICMLLLLVQGIVINRDSKIINPNLIPMAEDSFQQRDGP